MKLNKLAYSYNLQCGYTISSSLHFRFLFVDTKTASISSLVVYTMMHCKNSITLCFMAFSSNWVGENREVLCCILTPITVVCFKCVSIVFQESSALLHINTNYCSRPRLEPLLSDAAGNRRGHDTSITRLRAVIQTSHSACWLRREDKNKDLATSSSSSSSPSPSA